MPGTPGGTSKETGDADAGSASDPLAFEFFPAGTGGLVFGFERFDVFLDRPRLGGTGAEEFRIGKLRFPPN